MGSNPIWLRIIIGFVEIKKTAPSFLGTAFHYQTLIFYNFELM